MTSKLDRAELEQKVRDTFARFIKIDENGRRDLDYVLEPFADDVQHEIPFMDSPVRSPGKTALKGFLERTQGVFKDTIYTYGPFTTDVENQRVIAEMASKRTMMAGPTVNLRYVFVFQFRNGEISEFREYAFSPDAARVQAALGVGPKTA